MNATSVPPLLVSRLDCERLESLLEQPHVQGLNTEPLRLELDRAELLEPKEMPGDVITMNSTARFRDVNSGGERELTLVYPKDVDPEADNISILAPVGSALLGLSQGDEIEWPKPGGGMLRVQIEEVTYQPERSGEYHRY